MSKKPPTNERLSMVQFTVSPAAICAAERVGVSTRIWDENHAGSGEE